MPATDKITAAITIFKSVFPDARGKFRPVVSEHNGNEVEFYLADEGLYCTVNIHSGKVKEI